MLKIILNIAAWIGRPSAVECCAVWLRDPLMHPALQAMDARQLADLPIGHADGDECRVERPAQGHFTSGGRLERIELTLPPVLRPKMVPRS